MWKLESIGSFRGKNDDQPVCFYMEAFSRTSSSREKEWKEFYVGVRKGALLFFSSFGSDQSFLKS